MDPYEMCEKINYRALSPTVAPYGVVANNSFTSALSLQLYTLAKAELLVGIHPYTQILKHVMQGAPSYTPDMQCIQLSNMVPHSHYVPHSSVLECSLDPNLGANNLQSRKRMEEKKHKPTFPSSMFGSL